MSGIKQPTLGIVASVLIMALSLAFISLFDFPHFSGWVAYFLLCVIPMELVVSVTCGNQQPAFAGRSRQPLKGILLTLLCFVVGAIVAGVHYVTVGGSVNPPAPMVIMCIIASVAFVFWGAIMFGGWPFTTLIKNPLAAGLTMMVACYLINYGLFRLFFNYGFMRGAPVYVESLDPHGMFNAWKILVVYITVLTVLFVMMNFDLWPFTTSASLMKQPALGIVWGVVSLVIGGAAYYIGVVLAHMDPVTFMVKVPIPFIFGTIIMINMLNNTIFGNFKQPLKGVLNFIASAVLGQALAMLYSLLAPVVTGTLKEGPPAYDHEIWVASALLSVTFPFLVVYAEFFKMWPLQRAQSEQVLETAGGR